MLGEHSERGDVAEIQWSPVNGLRGQRGWHSRDRLQQN